MTQALDDSNVVEMIQNGKCVVMLTADFSGPCNLVRDFYENVARRKGNQISFYTFDLDGNTKFPQTIGAKAIPLFAFFEDGELQQTLVGAVGEDILLDKLEEIYHDN